MISPWIFLSFLLALITASGSLMLKYLGKSIRNDMDSNLIIGLLITVLAGGLALGLLCYHHQKTKKICLELQSTKSAKWIIPILSLVFIVNACLTTYVLNTADNPAYAQIIKNTNVVFILILSIFLFQSQVNKYCITGVFITLFGIMMIIYNC